MGGEMSDFVFYGLKDVYGDYRSLNDFVSYLKKIVSTLKTTFFLSGQSYYVTRFDSLTRPFLDYSIVEGVVFESPKEIRKQYSYLKKNIDSFLSKEAFNKLSTEDYHTSPFLSGKFHHDELSSSLDFKGSFYSKLLADIDYFLKVCYVAERGKKNGIFYEDFKERYISTKMHTFPYTECLGNFKSKSGHSYKVFDRVCSDDNNLSLEVLEIRVKPAFISLLGNNKVFFSFSPEDRKIYRYLLDFFQKQAENYQKSSESDVDGWVGKIMSEHFNSYKYMPRFMKKHYLSLYKGFGTKRNFTSNDALFFLDMNKNSFNQIFNRLRNLGAIKKVRYINKIKAIYRLVYIPEIVEEFQDGNQED